MLLHLDHSHLGPFRPSLSLSYYRNQGEAKAEAKAEALTWKYRDTQKIAFLEDNTRFKSDTPEAKKAQEDIFWGHNVRTHSRF